jgi:hypothetical protein
MQKILPLLLAALLLTACQDAVAPAPEAVFQIQSLTASINGPGTVGNWSTCTFTSTVSGGTAPYTYSWSFVGATSGYLSFNGSTSGSSVSATGHYTGPWGGTGSVYLILNVTDANGLTASPSKRINIPYYATSC